MSGVLPQLACDTTARRRAIESGDAPCASAATLDNRSPLLSPPLAQRCLQRHTALWPLNMISAAWPCWRHMMQVPPYIQTAFQEPPTFARAPSRQDVSTHRRRLPVQALLRPHGERERAVAGAGAHARHEAAWCVRTNLRLLMRPNLLPCTSAPSRTPPPVPPVPDGVHRLRPLGVHANPTPGGVPQVYHMPGAEPQQKGDAQGRSQVNVAAWPSTGACWVHQFRRPAELIFGRSETPAFLLLG
jgi:hypothetical protein